MLNFQCLFLISFYVLFIACFEKADCVTTEYFLFFFFFQSNDFFFYLSFYAFDPLGMYIFKKASLFVENFSIFSVLISSSSVYQQFAGFLKVYRLRNGWCVLFNICRAKPKGKAGM